ncbi:unnamed protein product [Vitrella brassicaformis CCMP3155]|uniref:WSC domain-containing protein n=4 Tax=Vitrella brassicaformis TaxID=1169539 RepID=A0A0G4G5B4_VITBC|nr:unnamed protein product [Vitrella brassicaformis CCMP3155]|eukprot:CEM23760.1 unnamed protein product [Vitrella brassicaformis CCMP3155]
MMARTLALVLVFSAALRFCSGLSLKSVQFWADVEAAGGSITPLYLPSNTYAKQLNPDPKNTARSRLSPWTFLGCYQGDVDSTNSLLLGDTDGPVACVEACEIRDFSMAVVRGSSCWCLTSRRNLQIIDEDLCEMECPSSYFEGTKLFCGGVLQPDMYSLYQMYDFVHATAGDAYDPWRFNLYRTVGMEELTYDNLGNVISSDMRFYVHTVSLSDGRPMFPYQVRLKEFLLMGLKYDIDDSRLLGFEVPFWTKKQRLENFSMNIKMFRFDSRDTKNIQVFTTTLELPNEIKSQTRDIYSNTALAAVDSLFDIYYLALPAVTASSGTSPFALSASQLVAAPMLVGGYDFTSWSHNVYAFDFNVTLDTVITGQPAIDTPRLLLNRPVQEPLALLESNSKYHDLYAAVLSCDPTFQDYRSCNYHYVKLGQAYRDNDTQLTEFRDTYVDGGTVVVNPTTRTQYAKKYASKPTIASSGSRLLLSSIAHPTPSRHFLYGATCTDHLTNVSFFVTKDSPDYSEPWEIVEVNTRDGFTREYYNLEVAEELSRGSHVITTLLTNSDPIIPLTLPTPQLEKAIFDMDGRKIYVTFDSFTIQGAVPMDEDGDFIPDGVDWSTQHRGLLDCSKVFAPHTASLLGTLGNGTSCQWTTAASVQVQLPARYLTPNPGDDIIVRERTVYAHVDGEWSNAASGGVKLEQPDPIEDPVVVVSIPRNIDLCSPMTIDASSSYNHGSRPSWQWKFIRAQCRYFDNGNVLYRDITEYEDGPGFVTIIKGLLAGSSAGSGSLYGSEKVYIGANDLRRGCDYMIEVTMTSKWGDPPRTTSTTLEFYKRQIPAPQAFIQGPQSVPTFRRKVLTLSVQAEKSRCEGLDSTQIASQKLKFEWRGKQQQTVLATGSVEFVPLNLEDLNLRTGSASLVIPAGTLIPGTKYIFSCQVGYEESFDDPDSLTFDSVEVNVEKSPIRASIRGGSRSVSELHYFAIDATDSVDPDFPDKPIEESPNWFFNFTCITPDGRPCFEEVLPYTTAQLPQPANCDLDMEETFQDVGKTYFVPLFPNAAGVPGTYICKYYVPGVVIFNTRREDALFGGSEYIFSVTTEADGRNATATAVITILEAAVSPPQVVIDPLTDSTVVATQAFRISGQIADQDKARFNLTSEPDSSIRRLQAGDEIDKSKPEVVYNWTIFQEVPNPKWNLADKAAAEKAGKEYLVPRSMFLMSDELTPARSPDAFASDPTNSRSLSLVPDVLGPDARYSFRLCVTVSNPYFPDRAPLTGCAQVSVQTAGPPPTMGSLALFVDEQEAADSSIYDSKTIVATDFSSSDTPLTYQFGFIRGGQKVNLRSNPIASPTQRTDALPAGNADDDYLVRIFVEVYTFYGVMTYAETTHKIYPPPTNEEKRILFNELLAEAGNRDPETAALSLMQAVLVVTGGGPSSGSGVSPVSTPAPDPNATTAPPTPHPRSGEDEARRRKTRKRRISEMHADGILNVLIGGSEKAAITPSVVGSYATVALALAEEVGSTDRMVEFMETMVGWQSTLTADDSLSESEKDQMAGTIFNSLGEMMAPSDDEASAFSFDSVNAGDPEGNVFFPRSDWPPPNAPNNWQARYRNAAPQPRGRYDPPPIQPRGAPAGAAYYRRLQLWMAGRPKNIPQMAPFPPVSFPYHAPTSQSFPSGRYGIVRVEPPAQPQYFQVAGGGGAAQGQQMRVFSSDAMEGQSSDVLEKMFIEQEEFEISWQSYIENLYEGEENITTFRAQDFQFFINLSDYLTAGERDVSRLRWKEERARTTQQEAKVFFQKGLTVKRLASMISQVCSSVFRLLNPGEKAKDFDFPLGRVRVGRTRNLTQSDESFSFQSENWQIPDGEERSYGYCKVMFTMELQPWAYAEKGPAGPFIMQAFAVYDDAGAQLAVEEEAKPVNTLTEHSSFAVATCWTWDWESNLGLGQWSRAGILNNEKGCSTTLLAEPLGVVGQFLDVTVAPFGVPAVVTEALDFFLTAEDISFLVMYVMAGILLFFAALHYWAFKQDEKDVNKPIKFKQLADGVTGPRSQTDPIFYKTNSDLVRFARTFWILLKRHHLVITAFYRDRQAKMTRLQQASCLLAAVLACMSTTALVYGKFSGRKEEWAALGFMGAFFAFPIARLLHLMFSKRPYRPPTLTPLLPYEDAEAGMAGEGKGGPPMLAFSSPQYVMKMEREAMKKSKKHPDEVQMLEAMPIPLDDEMHKGMDKEGLGLSPPFPPPPSPPPPPPSHETPSVALPNPQSGQTSPRLPGMVPLPPPPPPPPPGEAIALGIPPLPMPIPSEGGGGEQEGPVSSGMEREGPLTTPRGKHRLPPLETPKSGMSTPYSREGSGDPAKAPPSRPRRALLRQATDKSDKGMRKKGLPAIQSAGLVPSEQRGSRRTASPMSLSGLAPSMFQLAPLPVTPMTLAALPEPPADSSELLDDSLVITPLPPPTLTIMEDDGKQALMKSIRKMYMEQQPLRDADRLAFDERVDMRATASNTIIELAEKLAYFSVLFFIFIATLFLLLFALYFDDYTAKLWLRASGMAVLYLVVGFEGLKTLVQNIVEIQQFNARRRAAQRDTMLATLAERARQTAARMKGEKPPRRGKTVAIAPDIESPPPKTVTVVEEPKEATEGAGVGLVGVEPPELPKVRVEEPPKEDDDEKEEKEKEEREAAMPPPSPVPGGPTPPPVAATPGGPEPETRKTDETQPAPPRPPESPPQPQPQPPPPPSPPPPPPPAPDRPGLMQKVPSREVGIPAVKEAFVTQTSTLSASEIAEERSAFMGKKKTSLASVLASGPLEEDTQGEREGGDDGVIEHVVQDPAGGPPGMLDEEL